jgi:DNA repair exonuclease SbcCD ATPase subunit
MASLTNISEQVQVNGAATSETGRKIRALKNKLGGWRTDWDSAERSRQKIEKWEAERKDASLSSFSASASLATIRSQNVDGRLVVEEHLRESQRVLDAATARIRVIMAAS